MKNVPSLVRPHPVSMTETPAPRSAWLDAGKQTGWISAIEKNNEIN